MTSVKSKRGNSELDAFLKKMLNDAKSDPGMSLTDKMKIVDRVLKHEAIKAKLNDEGYGSGFNDD